MKKSIRLLMLLIAIGVGIFSVGLTSYAGPFDKVPMCRGGVGGTQILVFSYLVPRYQASSPPWVPGPCPVSGP